MEVAFTGSMILLPCEHVLIRTSTFKFLFKHGDPLKLLKMAENMDSHTPSSSSISIEELSDPNSFYKDFLEVVNATRMKLPDIDEHISSLNCITAATTLEAVTLFDPQLLSYLHDIEIKGRQMDKLVAATQEKKNNLFKLVDETDTQPIDYYAHQMEELGLLHNLNNTMSIE